MMNKTYAVLPMNNADLNVGTIYFTDAFLANNVVNPATQVQFTEEQKAALVAVDVIAPCKGTIAISTVDPNTVVWFDEEAAKKIVTYTAALMMKGTSIVTTDGTVVAEGFLASAMQDVVLSEETLTALHSEFTVQDGILNARKTEKIPEDDTNSYVTINGLKMENGIFEYDCLSNLTPDADVAARGFIGMAYRINDKDMEFEGFYIRPTNGRGCTNAFRKAHACQYFAYPGYIWSYFREFGIGDYEAPIDTIALGEWAHVKAVIVDDEADFYVNGTLALSVKTNIHQPISGRVGFNVHIHADCFYKNVKVLVLK